MTLTDLRYILALAQTQHAGRAAAICGVTQPNLSMAVRKLEDDLGILLFERSKQGFRPTRAGENIIAQAQRAIAHADAIAELAASDPQQVSGEFRLGALFTLGPYVFPPLIPQLALLASNLALVMHENYFADLWQQLYAGDLDAILISDTYSADEAAKKNILVQPLYKEALLVACSSTHPFAAKKIITASDLQEQDYLLLHQRQCLRQHMLAAFSPDPQRAIECSSLETLRHMIAINLGVSVLPSSVIYSGVQSSPLLGRAFESQPSRAIYLAWRASFPRHKAIDVVRRALHASRWQFTTAADSDNTGLLVDNTAW